MNNRYLYIIKQLQIVGAKEGIVVDCGCGEGVGSKFLYKEGYDVHSFDISDKNIEICRNKKINALYGDIRKIPLPNEFCDIFICSETLEHLSRKDSLKAAEEIIRVCKNGGYICVTVPLDKKVCLRGKYHKQFLSKQDLLEHFDNIDIIFEGIFCKKKNRCNLILIFRK